MKKRAVEMKNKAGRRRTSSRSRRQESARFGSDAVDPKSRYIAIHDAARCLITEEMIANGLYTKGQPDPDLIIRPSGEYRLSNFLIWQAAYSEFWFSDILWPDFKPHHLDEAIIEFQKRNRRFGGV